MRHLSIYTAISAVVTAGSIRKASESLAISPSALNRQIQALEAELGVPLFDRLAGGVRLSTAGEVYYQQFKAHLADMARARSRIADLQGLRIGHVSVRVAAGLGDGVLADQIAAYQGAHPAVSFAVGPGDTSPIEADLDAGRADLALALHPVSTEGMGAVARVNVPLIAVMAQDAPEKPETPLRLSDLMETALILPRPGTGLRDFITGLAASRRVPLRVSIETGDLAVTSLLRTKGAAQILPAIGVDEGRLATLGLRVRALDLPPVPVALFQPRGRSLPVAAAKFAEQLAGVLER